MNRIFRRSRFCITSPLKSSSAQGRAFSRIFPRTKQTSNEPSYLKGMRSPERSIRVMTKENARMPSDIGLLEKTFITPTGINRPSFLKSPLSVLKLEKTRLLARARDVLSLFICKFSSPKAKGFWDRSFNLDRSSLVPNATALHRQMYIAFSEGDDITLQSICLDGIRDKFRSRIANRPREEKVVWELIKYNKKPRLISSRAAKTPINGVVLRQAVVQICSRQKLTRYTMKRNGQLEQIQGSGKEKDVTEYVVIQRIYEQWQPLNWMIWGTTKEITMADVNEWNQI
ncbi:hypothetical protein GcC1_178005 [Golovinomyces cichoracearum]|uniref:Mitochondrial inner membrane protein Mba1 n=1 Tax=Golovinomyces cichoracearum TaxID=62708 RepID=A0A420HNX3_9PEZI|nr:hypothetical protein GcC1_178005 [Golovinomyces cichoracearum]